MDIAGKNVVFVGGLGGIGFETSKQFMTRNIANLVILDALENSSAVKTLQAMNRNTKVQYMKFDITDKSAIKSAISRIAGELTYIDVLVNGAGIVTDRNVELTMNVNLIGLINTTLEALPYMDKTRNGRGGVIANIASVLGLEPCSALAVYSASKFGVVGFTRSLADPYYFDLTGVSVMALCPGITRTPLVDHISGRDTFAYSKPLTDKLLACDTQSPAACGEHFVRIIEANQNGGLWISDLGKLRPIEPKLFWEMQFKNDK